MCMFYSVRHKELVSFCDTALTLQKIVNLYIAMSRLTEFDPENLRYLSPSNVGEETLVGPSQAVQV